MRSIEAIVDYFLQERVKLAAAESFTAGLLMHELCRVPGGDEVIDCGLVLHSARAKQRYLGVERDLLDLHGPVSETTAMAMARGALENNHANLAVANTGRASASNPGVRDAPDPGTVCMAWAVRAGRGFRVYTETRVFTGQGRAMRRQAALHALREAVRYHQLVFRQP